MDDNDMPDWYRQALINSLTRHRMDLKRHTDRRDHHDAKAREALAEIQRLRRELGE